MTIITKFFLALNLNKSRYLALNFYIQQYLAIPNEDYLNFSEEKFFFRLEYQIIYFQHFINEGKSTGVTSNFTILIILTLNIKL